MIHLNHLIICWGMFATVGMPDLRRIRLRFRQTDLLKTKQALQPPGAEGDINQNTCTLASLIVLVFYWSRLKSERFCIKHKHFFHNRQYESSLLENEWVWWAKNTWRWLKSTWTRYFQNEMKEHHHVNAWVDALWPRRKTKYRSPFVEKWSEMFSVFNFSE